MAISPGAGGGQQDGNLDPRVLRDAETGAGSWGRGWTLAPAVLTSVGHHDLLDRFVFQAPDTGRGSGGSGGSADT